MTTEAHFGLMPRGGYMHMVALYMVWYNFVTMHTTLRMTPAMAAGVSDKLWSVADLAEMIDATMPKPGKRGPYKKSGTALDV
jgi:hypothetical protein